MKVYHGSYTHITHIDLSKCQPNKDFGKGFYVTKFHRHAATWAEIIGEKHDTKGIVTEFDFTDGEFAESICLIKRFASYNDEWLDFVVANRDRKSKMPAHEYDIVEGPVADDKVQHTLRLYLKGKIAKEKFLEMLAHHEETHQICFCTARSLQLLDYTENAVDISCEMMNIGELLVEQLMLDLQIDEEKAADIFYTSAVFTQLAEESTKLYEKSWQEIYERLKKELETR
ncbi:MAG: DUF3990 domain-containing protein [Bacteroidales bacterium]|jgi:hypothetical protein|nr:DUF3990 domain-containing protein [Bacteroidales bacterium]